MRYVFGIGIGFDRNGDSIPTNKADRLVAIALRKAAEQFGGAFVQHGRGAWKAPGHDVTEENSIQLTVEGSEDTAEDFARYLVALFNQTTIIVSRTETDIRFVHQAAGEVLA